MEKMRIAVAGASGRMGRMLIESILAAPDAQLVAALDVPGSPAIGQDAGDYMGRTTGVTVRADVESALSGAQFLIDFTRPEGTLQHLAVCGRVGVRMVIGTTGFDSAGKQAIAAAAKQTAVMFAPNMSVGVNLTLKLIETAARALPTGYDVEIVEAHHRLKVDAPSGTALRMGEVIAKAMGRDHDKVAVYDRKGETGVRRDDSIGYAVVRGGDLVGDHTVMFLGTGERIEITHKASSRMTYAQGALRACRFLQSRPTGLYDMQDVLGLN